ncbi:hypothetical protein BH23BAC3_BH23BAC3_25190 [soil metagenome]
MVLSRFFKIPAYLCHCVGLKRWMSAAGWVSFLFQQELVVFMGVELEDVLPARMNPLGRDGNKTEDKLLFKNIFRFAGYILVIHLFTGSVQDADIHRSCMKINSAVI